MPTGQLQRKLGLWAAISLVTGSVIGSGIFMKPAVMASQTGSPGLLMTVWILAGVVSLFGGMINAEIAGMFPETGGQYVFFRKMYGDFFAFIYGWAAFIVINTAAIAAIAFVFAQYTEFFISLPRFVPSVEKSWMIHIPGIGNLYPLQQIGVKALAAVSVLVFTWINHYSVKAGGHIQVVFTVIKVLSLLLVITLIFFSGNGNSVNFMSAPADMKKAGWAAIMGFVAATSGALGAYDGWNNLGFVAGEIKNPAKNITRGLVYGIGICVVLYALTNLAYLYAMPIDRMKNSSLVAADALTITTGITGGGLIALMVIISTLGAVNGNIMPCCRIQFAMANDRLFFKPVGNVHSRHITPSCSLWLQAAWTCLFIFTGSFDMLFDMFVFITWLFYGFGAVGLFLLRKKMPDADRPYRVGGYPIVPFVFVLFSAFYFFLTLYNDIHNYIAGEIGFINSMYGLLLTLTGIPFYFYFRKRQRQP